MDDLVLKAKKGNMEAFMKLLDNLIILVVLLFIIAIFGFLIYKGLNYSAIDFKSNFSPDKEIIDIKLVVDGREANVGSHGWSGGGNLYTGSFGFGPVNTGSTSIKITNKSLNKTDIIDLNIK